jgi:hypothetical protein
LLICSDPLPSWTHLPETPQIRENVYNDVATVGTASLTVKRKRLLDLCVYTAKRP